MTVIYSDQEIKLTRILSSKNTGHFAVTPHDIHSCHRPLQS